MKVFVVILLLIIGIGSGYWLNEKFRADETDKIYVSLEKAIAQSKFNLVKDNYVEFFYLCEQDNPINNWKALMLATYTFQYGVDAQNIKLHKKGKNSAGKSIYTIEIKKIEMLSSEVSFMRTFTLEGAPFKNEEKLISESKDEMIKRRLFLGELRLYSKEANQIMNELKTGITNTVTSLAGALGEDVMIEAVIFPDRPPPIKHFESIRYQCGDINPLVRDNIR